MHEIEIPITLQLDSDGFVRRECPSCEQEFKWFVHDDRDPDAEAVGQYFCPLCGVPAGTDAWWTPAQLDYAKRSAAPDINQAVRDLMTGALSGIKGVTVKRGSDFGGGFDPPDPLPEPDDMCIVEPPCHPNEPVKIPDPERSICHCLICGDLFAV